MATGLPLGIPDSNIGTRSTTPTIPNLPGTPSGQYSPGTDIIHSVPYYQGNLALAQPIDQLPTIAPADPYAAYGGKAAYDNTVGGYDQGLSNTQAAIDRLLGTQNSGNQTIDNSFTNALNQLLLGKNQAQGAYDTTKQQTGLDYVGGKNSIRANAGSTLTSLLRLLGSRGAGGSSAFNTAAPGAVARNATIQQNDLSGTFGRNNQALDTNWGNYLTGYNNEVSSATNQRDQQKQDLSSSVETNRATLLQQLAQLSGQKAAYTNGDARAASQPYLDQANSVLDRLVGYTSKPIDYQTQAFQAPSLSSYTTAPGASIGTSSTAGSDYYAPNLSALLKKQLATA